MHTVHFREPKVAEWRSSGDHVQIVGDEGSTQPSALDILLHCSQLAALRNRQCGLI